MRYGRRRSRLVVRMLVNMIATTSLIAFGLHSAGAQTSVIPITRAASLSGEPVVLPEALRGRCGVLVLGFSQGSRDTVTEWGQWLSSEYDRAPNVLYYEMAMLASVPRPLRGFVVRSIRSSMPERAQAHFVPLTEDEREWRALVHYSETDNTYVLVVDVEGRVRWQTVGRASEAVTSTVKKQVGGLCSTQQ
jgi:hypothetical protein